MKHIFILLLFFSQFCFSQDITQLTLSQKAGQLLILGFNGTELTPQLKEQIKKIAPGGLIFFNKNLKDFKQMTKLTQDVKDYYKTLKLPEPWLAIDQEGAKVSRIKTNPALPNAITVGATQEPELANEFGQITGELLSTYGFNMNLAPVLDINSPYVKSFIGVRSFGNDINVVSKMGVEFSKGLLQFGVLPTAKHFPGTGNLQMDPHTQLTKIDDSLDVLLTKNLPPFTAFTQLHPSALMVSHVAFPNIDKSNMPSTYSNKITEDLLRNFLKYQGLVITDDLLMDGATIGDSIKSRVIKALYAGSDIVLLTWSSYVQSQAHKSIIDSVKDGSISEEFINERVRRILTAKAALKISANAKTIALESNLQSKPINIKINQFLNKLALTVFKNTRAPSSVSPLKFVTVITNSSMFAMSFKSKARKFDYKIINFPNTRSQFNKVFSNTNSFFLIQNQSILNAEWVYELTPEQKKQTLIVNNQYPGIDGKNDFLHVFDVFNNNKNIGGLAAAYMDKIIE